MNAPPCPYCGAIGHHTWAGEGGCPGAVTLAERDALAAFYLENLNRQALALRERMEVTLAALERERGRNLEELRASIERALPAGFKKLLTRAADALSYEMLARSAQCEIHDWNALIAELREAAQ